MDGFFGHQLVAVPRAYSASGRPQLFSFGGMDNFDEATNGLFRLDLLEKVVVARVCGRGTPPSPRFRHAMCFVERSSVSSAVQSLAVFGGMTPCQSHFGDLLLFDLLAEAWSRVELAGDYLPAHRACHSVAAT